MIILILHPIYTDTSDTEGGKEILSTKTPQDGQVQVPCSGSSKDTHLIYIYVPVFMLFLLYVPHTFSCLLRKHLPPRKDT